MQKITPEAHAAVVERCLEAYLKAGTMELSLDQLGVETGTTKRMLVHYFGNRQGIEERAIAHFERRLEDRFQPGRFASIESFEEGSMALWDRLTEPEFVPSLRLSYELFRLASKPERAQQFHDRLLQLWAGILVRYTESSEDAARYAETFKMLAIGFLSGPYDDQCRKMLGFAREVYKPKQGTL